MMNSETLAKSLQRFVARKATVDATTIPDGFGESHFGFYVYTRNGRRLAVEIWDAPDEPVR